MLPLHDIETFNDVAIACQKAGAIAIGIQQVRISPEGTAETSISLNPDKSLPLTVGPHDRVVILLRRS